LNQASLIFEKGTKKGRKSKNLNQNLTYKKKKKSRKKVVKKKDKNKSKEYQKVVIKFYKSCHNKLTKSCPKKDYYPDKIQK
jgi:hypothetical protein